MATITVDTFLDVGGARTAGETWAVNGCTLTIRTDTRWHANSPSSMLGSIGTITPSSTLGGSVVIDGTKVRWIAFSGGSGNVPAINTAITQSAAPGVTGTLLGVWASLDAAPSTVGTAMPSTGFLKFREVTGGVFDSAGAFTGIGCSAASAEGPGWIEVVFDQGANLGCNQRRPSVDAQGDWFDLGVTTGTPGQIIQLPTNGGGAGTIGVGVQIETAPGSGVYEWYGAVASSAWLTSRVTTDARAKLVESVGTGRLRIGQNGSAQNVGYTPPAGCKIRSPNVFFRQCTTAARNNNNIAASITGRPGFLSTGQASKCTFRKCSIDWNFAPAVSGDWLIEDCAIEARMNFASPVGEATIQRVCVADPSNTSATHLSFTGFLSNLNVSETVSCGTAVGMAFSSCADVDIEGYRHVNTATKSSGATAISAAASSNLRFVNTSLIASKFTFSSCVDVFIDDTDYVDRLDGPTTSASSTNIFEYATCTNAVMSGLTFGLAGALSNTHTYGFILAVQGNSQNIKLRNVGTRAAPLDCGGNSSLFPSAIVNYLGPTNMVSAQRVYLSGTRTSPVTGATLSNRNGLFEHLYGTFANAAQFNGSDTVYRSIGTTGATTTPANARGLHIATTFVSATEGRIYFFGSAPSEQSAAYVTVFSPLNSIVFADSSIAILTVNDYVEIETPYWVYNYTGFVNAAPVLNFGQTSNHTLSYQIDTGSGWSASKTLNAANLSAETISPTTGFKMRLRVLCNTANTGNNFNNLYLRATTTAAAQDAILYPLDVSTLTLTGLQPGSEVRCYTGTDPATAVEIGGTESSGTTFSFTHEAGGTVGYIRIFALGYQPLTYDPYTFSAVDTTLLVQQVVDRNYVNPA